MRAPATILGGLPVIVDVSFGQDYWGEYWAEVDALYWQKRDGTAGKALPQHIIDRAEAYDSDFCCVVDQVSDYIAYLQSDETEVATLDETPLTR